MLTCSRAFEVKYLPVTDILPSRVRIWDTRFRKGVTVTLHEQSTEDQAFAFFRSRNIEVTAFAYKSLGRYIFLTSNFVTQIK